MAMGTPVSSVIDRIKALPGALIWAGLFVILLSVWVATGEIKGGSVASAPDAVDVTKSSNSANQDALPFKVRVAVFKIEDFEDSLIIRGRSYSDQQVDIRAETAGIVETLPHKKGSHVKKGALLCELEAGARAASLLEAKALVAQAEGDYEASKTLVKRGHTASLRVLQNKAALDRAQAALARAELDFARTKIKAPFDGFIDDQPAKVGSYLAVGDRCAKLVSLNPLRVIGAVRERDVGKVKLGQTSKVKLVTGEQAEGVIRFIAASSDTETRTFRIEIEIDNPGASGPDDTLKGQMKSGITADIEIPVAKKKAMRLPPSMLTLNDKGDVGVRAVNNRGIVEFLPVKILSEKSEGIWIEALPSASRLITVGQDFVKEGQKVEPVPDANFKANTDVKPGS